MILLLRRSRFLILVFALVQLALPGALGIADALSAESSRGSVAHIEETSRQQCRAPHADDCIVCRHLSTNATRCPASPDLLPQTSVTTAATAADIDLRSVSQRGFRSRAPPEAVI